MKTLNIFTCLLLCSNLVYSQASENARVVWSKPLNDLRVFIENKGQFTDIDGEKVLYAYIGDKEKYYLTTNGLIIRIDTVIFKENPLRKILNVFHEKSSYEEKEREYYQYQYKYIKATWKNIESKQMKILPVNKKEDYYTFYGIAEKCEGYDKIIYQNIYPNIDIEYYIPKEKKVGIKYNIILHQNANIEDLSLVYSGDVKNINLDNYGNLIIENDIHPLKDRLLRTYYLNNPNEIINSSFVLKGNEVKFFVEQTKKDVETLVIDPWISGIGLSGDDYGYDVEYDFLGNLYVYVRQAGGSLTVQKFSPTGNILWTHIVTSDNTYDGNFLVDKISNKLYVCEGFNAGGARAYRLDLNGVVDGFISQQNGSFREMWDMIFDCKMNRIIGIGGGTNSNLNGGLINPSNGTVSIANFTGVNGTCQDVVNGCVDNQGRVFVFFAVPTDGESMPIANKLMLLNPSLNGNIWNVNHGMYSFQECSNHPFLDPMGCGGQNSNAYNAMDVNDFYLYFYDGRSLRAFDPNNGTSVAATSVGYAGQWYTPLSCGGIAVDDCNTIYLGGPNANILYYSFNGSTFTGPQNISLGWPGTFVWDIKYDRNTNMLYVSGYNGVAVVYAAPSASCINNSLTSSVSCSGANSGNVTVTVNTTLGQPVFNYTWYNSSGTQISQTLNSNSNTNTVNNLQNGTYIVQVHINPLCGPLLTDTIEVNCPNCGANVTFTPVSCFGGNDGSATIAPVEGQSPFTYLWSNGDNHQTITDLTAGTYSVTFTDANNCNLVYHVTVTQPAQLQAQVIPQHLVCYNSNDGVASVIATGGTPPYQATWNSGQLGLVAQQLAPGSYSVTITDANQCSITASTVIQNAPILTIDASANPPALCPGNSSQLQVQGAVFYQWQPSTNLSSDTGSVVTFSSLQSGTFTYTVTGYVPHIGNNIINNGNFEMGNMYFNSQYNYNSTSTVSEAEYSITPNPFNAHPDWSQCADHTTGNGNMMVVNGSSTPNTNVWCQQVNVQPNTDYVFSAWLTSIHPTNPAILQFSINGNMLGNPFNISANTCQWNQFFETWNSGMNTTAQICIVNQNTVLSGNDFAIDDIYFAPIVYCTATDTVTVTTYPVPTSTFTVSNILCNGDASTVQYTGNASSNATFSWNWGGGNAIPGSGMGPHQVSFTNSGSYNITLTVIENGCTSQPTTVSVNNPPLLSVSAHATDVKCNGGNDGTISSTISGGTPPYTFAWSNGAATQNLQNVPAGIYTITVTDANGCSKTAGATVNQPTPLVASVSPSQHICVGQPAYLNITASGGTPPYQYFWNGQPSTASTVVYPQSTTTYTASVVDANGCSTDVLTTTVYVAPPLNVNLLANTYNVCPGDPVMLTPVIWGGVGPPYVIYNQDGDVVTPPIYIYPMQSGWYTIRAEDACGSWDTARVYINVYPLPPVNILADVLQGCVPLTVQFNEVNPDSGQTYVWNFGDMTNLSLSKNPVHTYTTPGVFDVTITVTSANGCKNTVVYNDMIQVWPQPNAAFVWSPELINEIKPEVQFTNLSTGASTYQWMFGDGDSSSKVHPYHRYPGVGSYQVQLVAVSNKGCTDTAYAIIKVLEQYTFYAPTAFSPDGDRVNDFFYVVAHGIKEEGFYLEVYDRWGEVIWRTEKFHKDEERSDKWDGRAKNGQVVPVGTYTWRCVFRDVMDKLHEETGAVNVIR